MGKHLKHGDEAVRAKYVESAPKQFGTLHERMKYLMALLQKHGPESIPHDVWHAIFDLETEVTYHKPSDPPFGRRRIGTGGEE